MDGCFHTGRAPAGSGGVEIRGHWWPFEMRLIYCCSTVRYHKVLCEKVALHNILLKKLLIKYLSASLRLLSGVEGA